MLSHTVCFKMKPYAQGKQMKENLTILEDKLIPAVEKLIEKKIKVSKEFLKEIYNITEKYDYYITGSDQVWNPLFNFINKHYLI